MVNQNPPVNQGHGAVPIGEPVKIQHPPADSDTTTLAFGQAEPGRDIFAGHPHDEIKSVEKDNEPKPEDKDEKAISSVNTNTESVTEAAKVAEPATESTESSSTSSEASSSPTVESSTAETSSTESTSSSSESASSSTSADETPAHAHEHAGPKVEEEAEADRVREALYPDAR